MTVWTEGRGSLGRRSVRRKQNYNLRALQEAICRRIPLKSVVADEGNMAASGQCGGDSLKSSAPGEFKGSRISTGKLARLRFP